MTDRAVQETGIQKPFIFILIRSIKEMTDSRIDQLIPFVILFSSLPWLGFFFFKEAGEHDKILWCAPTERLIKTKKSVYDYDDTKSGGYILRGHVLRTAFASLLYSW